MIRHWARTATSTPRAKRSRRTTSGSRTSGAYPRAHRRAEPARALPDLLDRLPPGRSTLDLPPGSPSSASPRSPGRAVPRLAEASRRERELHLFLLDPSPAAVGAGARLRPPGPDRRRSSATDDASARVVRHPLLRSWGRPHRERTVLLAAAEHAAGPSRTGSATPGPRRRRRPPPRCSPGVQADLRGDGEPGRRLRARTRRPLDPGPLVPRARPSGRGAARRDPAPARRRPDAARGGHRRAQPGDRGLRAAGSSPASARRPTARRAHGRAGPAAPRVPHRRPSLRDAVPLLAALDTLLELVAGRFTASAVLEFLALAPVRLRFDLDDDAIA